MSSPPPSPPPSPSSSSSARSVAAPASPLGRALQRLFDAPYVLLTLTALLWAGNVVVGRAAAGHIPPITLACIRWLGATALLLPFAWPQLRRDWPIVLRHIPVLLLLSATGIACYNTMSYFGLQYTQALNGLLVQSVSPLMIALCSFLLFRDRLSRGQVLGILVSLAGVTMIVCKGDLDVLLHMRPNPGDLWILAAVLIYAFYAAILRLRPPLGQMSFLAVIMALGGLQLLPFAIHEAHQGLLLTLDRPTLATIAYVMTGPSLIAYLFFNRGVELVGANRAAPFFHLMPVFGSVLAIAFLGERLEWYHGAGYALVLAGILIATRAGRRAATG